MEIKKGQFISDLNIGARVSTIFAVAKKQIKNEICPAYYMTLFFYVEK